MEKRVLKAGGKTKAGGKKGATRARSPHVARLAVFKELAGEWYWEQDECFRFTELSGSVLKKLGIDSKTFLGTALWDHNACPVNDLNWDRHKAVLASGKPFSDFVFQFVNRRGAVRYINCGGKPVFDASRRCTGYYGIARDITAMVQMERRLVSEHGVTRLLAEYHDVTDATQQIMRMMGETLGWACGAHWAFDTANGKMRCVETWGIASAGIETFLETTRAMLPSKAPGGLMRRAWTRGQPVWISDVVKSKTFARAAAAKKAGLHSAFAFPIKAGTKVIGVMEFFNHNVCEPMTELLASATYIGSQIGQVMQRKHAEEEERASRQLLEDIVEHMPTAVQLKSVQDNFRYVVWNKASEALYGLPRSAAIGHNAHDLLPQEAADHVHAMDLDVIAQKTVQNFPDCTEQTAQGKTFREHVRKVPLFDADGNPTHILVIADDNTARMANEAKLRASEQRFRELTRLSSDWFWEQDDQFRFTFFSGPLKEKTGSDEVVHLGKTRWDVPTLNHTAETWAAHKAALARHEPFHEFEICRLGVGAKPTWSTVSGTPTFADDGTFTGYRGVGKDITASRQHLQLLRMEHEVTRQLADAENSEAALTGALRAVCEGQGWDYSEFYSIDTEANLLRWRAAWGIDDQAIKRYMAAKRGSVYASGVGLIGTTWQSGQMLWVPDINRDPRTKMKSAARDSGIHGAICVPVLSAKETIGVLAFFSREVREPDELLIQSMQIVGSQISQFDRRKQAEQEERESRQLLENIVEHMPIAVQLISVQDNFRYVLWNKASETITGLPRSATIGHSVHDLLPRDIADHVHAINLDVIARKTAREFPDHAALTIEGKSFREHLRKVPLFDTNGNPTHVLVVADDITERLAAEQHLKESERRLAAVVHVAGQYVWELDADLRYTYLSGRVEQVIGFRIDEMLGKHAAEFITGGNSTLLEEWLEGNYQAAQGFHTHEHRAVTKSGSSIWLRVSGAAVFDEQGKLTGYRGTSQDISLQKEAARREQMVHATTRLLAESATLSGAVRSIIQMVCEQMRWACGARWRLDESDASLHCLEVWGVAGDDAVTEFLKASRRLVFLAESPGLLRRVITTGAPLHIDDITSEANYHRAGIAVPAGLHGLIALPLKIDSKVFGALEFYSPKPLVPDAGLLDAIARIGGQIAQSIARREAEAVTRRAQDLARSNAELQQFAYVASHDLQEPLRMISSYTQLLMRRLEGKLDQDSREFADFIIDGSARMKKLIEDLLTYSRVGSRGARFAATDCATVLAKVLTNLKTTIEASGAVITHAGLPVLVADESQLLQLWQNLISNAIKFCDQNAPHIHVGAEERADAWVLSVKDNGIGIEPQYFERIFVMFQRLHGKADYPGTGIGLAICQKVMDQHGGHIQVDSQPGQGSTFYCSFPKRQTGGAETL